MCILNMAQNVKVQASNCFFPPLFPHHSLKKKKILKNFQVKSQFIPGNS